MATTGTIPWERVRRAGAKLTTPLHPDDYLRLLNPLWSSRELRGRIERVIPETDDAATLVIRPGWGWRYDHRPGQYVGIGVQVEGRFQWRSYSVSSPPKRDRGTIAITVRAMPEGLLSGHLVKGLEPGTIVRLALPEGDFVLPDPPPQRMLFLVGGSGITPVIAMLRTLDRRGTMPDVVLHYSSPIEGPDDLPRRARGARGEARGLTFHELHTDTDGMLDLADLDEICPDWRSARPTPAAPGRCSTRSPSTSRPPTSRTTCTWSGSPSQLGGEGGEGGTITFRNSGKTIDADGATTVLEAGEEAGIGMPFGCRMGICHTCTLTLVDGTVRDLRNGDEYDNPNEPVQTCVTAAVGDCTLDI